MGVEELGTLNLADADTSAGNFDPIPASSYDAHIHEVDVVEIEKDTGKLPMGTPGYNIQFRVDGGKYDNRVLFKRYYIPGAGYDAEKRKKSLGIFVNFLKALGYTEEEVMSGEFKPDHVDWLGKEVKVSVRVKAAVLNDDGEEIYPAGNEITSVKPRNAATADSSAGVL